MPGNSFFDAVAETYECRCTEDCKQWQKSNGTKDPKCPCDACHYRPSQHTSSTDTDSGASFPF